MIYIKFNIFDKFKIKVENVDIMKWPENKDLHDQYMFDIPVGFVKGKELFRHRVDEDEVLKRLKSIIDEN